MVENSTHSHLLDNDGFPDQIPYFAYYAYIYLNNTVVSSFSFSKFLLICILFFS